MKIVLTKKAQSTDKDPLLVTVANVENAPKQVLKFEINKPIEIDDETAMTIMGDKRYKGLFKVEGMTNGYKTKTAHAEA
jgi:hypothetical protein